MQKHHHAKGRHESQKQARAKAQMRIARTHAHELRSERTDTPSPLTDIGIDRISELIRSVTGTFDDAFQEAWATVLGDHVACEEDILRIAKECRRKQVSEEYTINHRISLDAPAFKESGQSDGASPPLSEYTAAPPERTEEEIDQAIENEEARRKRRKFAKRNNSGRITLPQYVVEAIQKIYPHDSLTTAIHKLSLVPFDGNQPYSLWEDAIVEKMYPWGGSKAVKLMLNRSLDSISTRAVRLGVKRLLHGSPPMDYATIKQMADLLKARGELKKARDASQQHKEGGVRGTRTKRQHLRYSTSYNSYRIRWCYWMYQQLQPESITNFLQLLHTDETLMKRCFFEKPQDIPGEPALSRFFAQIEAAPFTQLRELNEAYPLPQSQHSLFYSILHNLCMAIPQPSQTLGRPRLILPDMVFSIVAQAHSRTSGRKFTNNLRGAEEQQIISKAPSYNSVFRYLQNPRVTPILKQQIEKTAELLLLKTAEPDFITESSIFPKGQRYIKAQLTSGVKTHIVTSISTSIEVYPKTATAARYTTSANSTSSMIQNNFGASLKSKSPTAQANEVLCKVLCHNICVLTQSINRLGLEPVFSESLRECTREEKPCA